MCSGGSPSENFKPNSAVGGAVVGKQVKFSKSNSIVVGKVGENFRSASAQQGKDG